MKTHTSTLPSEDLDNISNQDQMEGSFAHRWVEPYDPETLKSIHHHLIDANLFIKIGLPHKGKEALERATMLVNHFRKIKRGQFQ